MTALPSHPLPFVLLAALAGPLAACGPNYSPDTYASTAVQQANKVEQGMVAGVRKVDVVASGATGAAAGAAAGGVLGATVPGSSTRTALTALGGGLVGGAVGSAVERATGDTTAFEYIVRKSNGDMLSVTQKDVKPLDVGQKVLVITGNQARIVPDYTVPTETANAAASPPAVQATPSSTPPVATAATAPSNAPVALNTDAPAPLGARPSSPVAPDTSPFMQRWRDSTAPGTPPIP